MAAEYIITKIERAKRRREHVNIFLDDAYWLNVHQNFVVDHDLYKEKKLTEEEKRSIEEQSRESKQLERIYRFLSLRPHSRREIQQYLRFRLRLPLPQAEELLTRFKQEGFVSDVNFARWYVRNRQDKPAYGEQKIRFELVGKSVKKEIIDRVLAEFYNEATREREQAKIRQFIVKNLKRIKAKDDYERQQKMIQKLMARGFSYSDIKGVIREE